MVSTSRAYDETGIATVDLFAFIWPDYLARALAARQANLQFCAYCAAQVMRSSVRLCYPDWLRASVGVDSQN